MNGTDSYKIRLAMCFRSHVFNGLHRNKLSVTDFLIYLSSNLARGCILRAWAITRTGNIPQR
ncbi:MAG: hypothetical protein ACPHL4_02795, partial [Acidimicrobiales bacterium]